MWSDTLDLPEDKRKAKLIVLPEIIRSKGPIAAVDYVNQMQDPILQTSCVSVLVRELPNSLGLDETVKWVNSLPDGVKSVGQLSLIESSAIQNTDHLTQIALSIAQSGARNQAIRIIESQLFQKDPVVAADWIRKLPVQNQEAAVLSLVQQWYDTDSLAMSDWLYQMENSPIKNKALESLAYRLNTSDVAAARDVAKQINDPKQRDEVLRSLR